MKYFAYGSNMCTNRLRSRIPSFKFYIVATLKRYELKFHKRSTDGSGKCNAYYTGNDDNDVFGVVFEIDDVEKSKLDEAEGVGHGYHETPIEVITANGLVHAYMYVSDPDSINDSLIPYTWYKDFVVNGAKQHRLPKEYIRNLETVEACSDTDKNREARKRSLLPC